MSKVLNLRFPVAGINRRLEYSDFSNMKSAFPTPWAVNVRPDDTIASRRRGGSRPGLTKYLSSDFGTTITSIVPVPSVSSSGATKYLAVIADGYLGVIENGTLTSPGGYLKTETGDYVTTEEGDRIVLSTASVPSDCFLVVRNGKVYAITTSAVYVLDLVSGVVNALTASKGSVPTGCTFGAIYRGRLVLAGGDNAVYLSRQGDPTDWDYGADMDNSGRAVPFQLSGGGQIGEVATALIPHNDAYMLAATKYGLWVIHGDPCDTGSLARISGNVGIVSDAAWCKVGDTIVFLSMDGLYSVSANGSNLTPLSDDRLPVELQDIDTATTTVRMAHKNNENGVHLFLTPSSGIGQHWFFDLKERGFWLDGMQADHQPTAVCEIDGDVVLACKDGYLRSIGGSDDDGTDIQSHVLIGPLRISRDPNYGLISNIHGSIGDGSGSVTWRLVTGETADEAAANARAAVEAYRGNVNEAASEAIEALASYSGSVREAEDTAKAAIEACTGDIEAVADTVTAILNAYLASVETATATALEAIGDYSGSVDDERFIDIFRMSLGWWSAGEINPDYSQYVKYTGTLTAGRSRFAYPKTRAMWAVVWIQSNAQWAYESIFMETQASGRWR